MREVHLRASVLLSLPLQHKRRGHDGGDATQRSYGRYDHRRVSSSALGCRRVRVRARGQVPSACMQSRGCRLPPLTIVRERGGGSWATKPPATLVGAAGGRRSAAAGRMGTLISLPHVAFDMAITISDALGRVGSAQQGSETRQPHSGDDGVHVSIQTSSEASSGSLGENAARMLPSTIKLRLHKQPLCLQSI